VQNGTSGVIPADTEFIAHPETYRIPIGETATFFWGDEAATKAGPLPEKNLHFDKAPQAW